MNQLNQILVALAIPLGVILYIFFWCGVMIAIGRFGGWILLAKTYRTNAPFEGQRWHFQSAQFRWSCNYSGALTVGADATGLYLSTLLPFRPGHPALFIPWSETRIEMKQSRWMGKYMEVQFPNAPSTLVRFSEKLANRIAAVGFERSNPKG